MISHDLSFIASFGLHCCLCTTVSVQDGIDFIVACEIEKIFYFGNCRQVN